MFDLLKKRISGFVDKLSGKAEKEGEKPEETTPIEEEKTVSVEKVEEAAPLQTSHIGEAPAKIPEVVAEEEPPNKKEESPKPKAAKPKKAEAEKKKEEPAPAKAAQKEEEGKGKPAKKKETKEETAEAPPPKEAPKNEEAKGKAPQEPLKKRAEPKKEEKVAPAKEVAPKEGGEESPAPRQEPKAKEAKEEPKERKKGFLESVFGGLKKEGAAKPKAEKEEATAPKEAKEAAKKGEPGGEKEEAPEAPIKKKAGHLKEEAVPAPPKAEVPGEKAQKKEEELKKKVKKGLLASVSETIRGESEIKEEEIAELLDELELGMLESDVALSVAEEIKEELRKRIVGSKVKRGQTAIFVRDSLKDILLGMFRETPGFEISKRLGEEGKPHKIMVVGPNGAGKTTTIAKIVNLLKKEGHSACIAAADTFRAAAVEQLVHHGGKLGVSVIHGAYGSDPTSIAFDALNHARANEIEVVIIDTAGRQDTNVNLINQLKKMDRVIKPEMKIYVGESIAGNAMVEQISTFNNEIGLDGVVLTKLDCDPKGGTVISVSRVARLPILYVGTGQGYGDLRKFNAEEIVEEILS